MPIFRAFLIMKSQYFRYASFDMLSFDYYTNCGEVLLGVGGKSFLSRPGPSVLIAFLISMSEKGHIRCFLVQDVRVDCKITKGLRCICYRSVFIVILKSDKTVLWRIFLYLPTFFSIRQLL